jgi:DNA processing protein
MATPCLAAPPEQLLGPVNAVERCNLPPVLYVAGAVSLLKLGNRVSVVGSRNASGDGLRRAARLARELAQADVTVVSGLAAGIDTAAHRAAIEAGGHTIAVLGTPLDVAYPAGNRALQRLIAEEHLLVSQFPPGTPIHKSNFPRRNRVMALISDATVIVEAGEGSGALSQGWEAIRLGRPLFVMRAVAEDRNLEWPAEMMKYGAMVLAETAQVIAALPPPEAGGTFDALAF